MGTHSALGGDALERLSALPQGQKIVVMDTAPIAPVKRTTKLRVLSVTPLTARPSGAITCGRTLAT